MKFGLNQKTINKINSVFELHSQIEEVLIYGSRAKGNYREGSDIDITLIGKNIELSKINENIDDLNTPYLFDISIFDKLDSKDLIEHINRVGKTFYKKVE
ncbi:nucleotidyltransferase domain-containing protein [Flavobacterium sp.]|uniref:nucleotidyltransferase domain-containing protein n=1 Tax=Flavobacterium sp. TaxID=239 RepID=UPI0037530C03